MTSEYKYKLSIIVDSFNKQGDIEKTIKSILMQSPSVQKRIQTILIENAEVDILSNLKEEEYLERIDFIRIRESNPNINRSYNIALEKSQAEYLLFLYPGMILEKKALEETLPFLDKNPEELDLFMPPEDFSDMEPFTKSNINIKNILDCTDEPRVDLTCKFISNELAKKYRFEDQISTDSTVLYLTKILSKAKYYGEIERPIIEEVTSESLSLSSEKNTASWYLDSTRAIYPKLIEILEKEFNCVPAYTQNILLNDLKGRLRSKEFENLKKNNQSEYIESLHEILTKIDIQTIVDSPKLSIELKVFLLSLRNKSSIPGLISKLNIIRGELFLGDKKLIAKDSHSLEINSISYEAGELTFDGVFKTLLPKDQIKLNVNYQDESIQLDLSPMRSKNVKSLGQTIFTPYYFKSSIKVLDPRRVTFTLQIGDTQFRLEIGHIRGLESNYLIHDRKIFLFQNKKILIVPYKILNFLRYETLYLLRLLKRRKLKSILIRVLYFLLKPFKRREIWIFSDKLTEAGDNGEVFYKYVTKQNPSAKRCFLINEDSLHYDRINKIGDTVEFTSLRYKLLFLLSDMVISSQASNFVVNAFGSSQKYYNDLYHFDFIFLQHGVIKHDLSSWLSRVDKNIDLFVTSAEPEYRSILENDYFYTKDEVKLTGLPRFDQLDNKPQNQILLMPTWRRYLSSPMDTHGVRKADGDFKNSEYYKQYNRLINDPLLLELLSKYNFKLKFCLHPGLIQNAPFFKDNELVTIPKRICNYSEEFSKSRLLITDYSSVEFDFAYLRKPIIYFQFDYDEFFNLHTVQKSYFDYEEDGFGPLTSTIEGAIKSLESNLERDFELEDKYEKRINNFFKYNDKNNCERVYRELLKVS
jgi:CDP-glycerol glycerophosphotransferase (TagB/SpsB family)